jgi:phytoene desaturase
MNGQRIAVVGGGLGGLTAAGLLARRGLSVTLFEASGALGGKAQARTVDGITLDLGPTLLTLPHLVRETFAQLGASAELPPLTELLEQCHYRFADGCGFVAHRDVEATAESAALLRPAERRGVRGFYAEAEAIWKAAGEPYLEAPFEGMAGYLARVARKRGLSGLSLGAALGTLDALARRHFRTEHLQQFAGRFATYTGASPYQASAAFALIPHIERAYGVHHVQGGIGALVDGLARAAQGAGVEVRLGQRARWERTGKRWLVGPAGEREEFDAVVVNEDPLASLGREGEQLALSGYVLLLGTDAASAREVPHHAVLFGADYEREFDQLFAGRLADDPTVYVCHPGATDASMAPPGRAGLFVMANAPALPLAAARGGQDWAREAERVRGQCLEKLFAHYPSLKGRVSVLGERTPADLQALGAPGGSIYGFLPHGKLGPFRRPRIRGDAPGLFFAGGGTHPGGGVPLCMLSGRFAAELAASHVGAAPPPGPRPAAGAP